MARVGDVLSTVQAQGPVFVEEEWISAAIGRRFQLRKAVCEISSLMLCVGGGCYPRFVLRAWLVCLCCSEGFCYGLWQGRGMFVGWVDSLGI